MATPSGSSKSGATTQATGASTAWTHQVTGPQMLEQLRQFVRDVVPKIQQDRQHFQQVVDQYDLDALATYPELIANSCAGFPEQWANAGRQTAGQTHTPGDGGGRVYKPGNT